MGSGTGAFTLALADVMRSEGQIISIDKDRFALRKQAKSIQQQFPKTAVFYQTADYTKPLNLPLLDGIVMANTLHFHQGDKRIQLLKQIRDYLKPDGRLIVVEYDTDRGNHWVPYPMSFYTWQAVAAQAGFAETTLLAMQPSRFLGQIFSALSLN